MITQNTPKAKVPTLSLSQIHLLASLPCILVEAIAIVTLMIFPSFPAKKSLSHWPCLSSSATLHLNVMGPEKPDLCFVPPQLRLFPTPISSKPPVLETNCHKRQVKSPRREMMTPVPNCHQSTSKASPREMMTQCSQVSYHT